jgi:hypothetical protein
LTPASLDVFKLPALNVKGGDQVQVHVQVKAAVHVHVNAHADENVDELRLHRGAPGGREQAQLPDAL